MANDAFIESLKDTALFLPRSPGKQLETQLRGGVCGRWPVTGVSFPLLNSKLAAATGLLSGLRPLSSETRYLWFQKWIRWGG